MTTWILSSSALIGGVLLLRRLIRGKISPRIQYAVWLLVLVRLLMPFSLFESGLSVQNLQEEALKQPQVQQIQQVINTPIIQQRPAQNPQIPQNPATPQETVGQGNVTQTPQQAPTNPDPAVANPMTLADIALYVWLGGMAVMTIWLLACNLHFLFRLQRDRRTMDIPVSPLPVYRTDAVETPCLFGLFHPAIYLTDEVAEEPVVLRYVLTHELTHYRQFDHIWSLLRTVTLILHWYNPLVRLAFRASQQDCEMACDEGTLKQLGEEHRGDYGRTLIRLATHTRLRTTMITATTLSDGKQAIRERILILMKNPKTAMLTMVSLILCCAIIVGCTFTGAAGDREETEPSESTESLSTDPTTPMESIPTDPVSREILDMFHYDNPEYRWLFMSTSCIFDDPSQIDLLVILYNGLPGNPVWQDFTEEEQNAVTGQFSGGVYTAVDRLPATQIDELLIKYFGTTLTDVQIPDLFAYYDKTDSYYHQHGDVIIPAFTIDAVEELDENHLRVYYTHSESSFAAAFGQLTGGNYVQGASMVMELHKANGIWQPRSNRVAQTDVSLESFETLGELLTDRLYDPRQTDALGVFRLTELDTGNTYHALKTNLFDFRFSNLLLDWENAVKGDYTLYYDDTIMVQVENLDGSFYVQFHDGKDADWIYVSECDRFVPLLPNPEYENTKDPASKIQSSLYNDYDFYLEAGRHIPNFGNGDPQSTVDLLTKAIPAYFRRAAQMSKTGRIEYEDVEISNVYWKLNEDGSMLYEADLKFIPDTIAPKNAMILWTLTRLEDGYWYRDTDIAWHPTGRPLPSVISVPWEVKEQVTMPYEEYFAQIRPYSLELDNLNFWRSFDGYSVLYGQDCFQVVKGINTPVLTVPNVDTTIDWIVCDTSWIYGIRNGQELVRVSYSGGQAQLLCNVAEVLGSNYGIAQDLYLGDGAVLFFSACSESGSTVCRLYLPDLTLDILVQTNTPEALVTEALSNHELVWYEENLAFKQLMRSIEADPPAKYILPNGELVDNLEGWVSADYEVPQGFSHYVNTSTGEAYTLPSYGNFSSRTQSNIEKNGEAWWNDFRTP